MYCPSCGTQLSVEIKYCNRCGANLSLVPSESVAPERKPTRLALPALVLGLTITGGIGIVFGGASEMAKMDLPAAAITFMVLFGMATLFGCTALILRFWLKVLTMNREVRQPAGQNDFRPAVQMPVPYQQLTPRLEPIPSVTEHTTRTFSPAYREGTDPTPQ